MPIRSAAISRVPGQELQRGERIGHPGRQRRAGAGADDRGLAQAPRAETVVGQRREPAPAQLRRQPALVGLPEAADRVDHHHRRIPIPRLIGKAERRGDRHVRRRLAREDLTEVGVGARAKRHQLDRAGTRGPDRARAPSRPRPRRPPPPTPVTAPLAALARWFGLDGNSRCAPEAREERRAGREGGREDQRDGADPRYQAHEDEDGASQGDRLDGCLL